jgi:hypothetical protein
MTTIRRSKTTSAYSSVSSNKHQQMATEESKIGVATQFDFLQYAAIENSFPLISVPSWNEAAFPIPIGL